jgi:glycosyltransferase involved in cell wall biosynthesis
MKVLHVINSLGIGGAESLLVNYLISAKDESHVENDVCVLYDSEAFLYKRAVAHGIKIFNLHSKRKYSICPTLRLIWLIRRNSYGIVHVHLFPSLYYCSLASLFTPKVRYIYTEHSISNRRRKHKIISFLDRLSYRAYKKIICVSEAVKVNLIEWMPYVTGKTTVIYNGIPIEKIKEQEKKYDLILVGSMNSNVKGVDIFLKALCMVKDHISKAAIAGDGKLKIELMELRNHIGLREKVDFLGNRGDINSLLEQSRIFVQPSRREGLPTALLEAMAKAMPVISTNIGGIPEAIENGKNGIIIRAEAVEELAIAILKLLTDRDLVQRLGEKAQAEVISRFSIEIYKNRLIKEYEKLLI